MTRPKTGRTGSKWFTPTPSACCATRPAPRAIRLSALILRMHDHKGDLFVVCARPLPGDLQRALRCAWRDLGNESEENVSFEEPRAERWKRVWEMRRFCDGQDKVSSRD